MGMVDTTGTAPQKQRRSAAASTAVSSAATEARHDDAQVVDFTDDWISLEEVEARSRRGLRGW
jgi:hypothetical protein